jgi:predicted XRE-type DNA-binding protein
MKELRFVGTSLADLARFPAEAKRAAGFDLWQVQNGLEPSDRKPMNGVGAGVREIRIRSSGALASALRGKVHRGGLRLACIRQEDTAHGAVGSRLGSETIRRGSTAMKSRIVTSSGNVFADLGFPPEEVAVLTLRAELMVALRKLIATRGWTQAQAAEVLGVTQSRVSDLVRGKHDKFSLDMLVTFAARAGRTVKLRLAA